MLEPSFIKPIEGEPAYDSFLDDNSFIYSAIVKCVEDHEALRWINKDTLRNDGITSWHTIVKWYDSESIEESLSASTLNKTIALKLKDVYLGACSTFITTFASYLDIFEEEEVPLPPRLARDLFLMNITHESYSTIKNELRRQKKSLTEDIKSLSLNIENGQRKTQRQIRIQKQQERERKGELMYK